MPTNKQVKQLSKGEVVIYQPKDGRVQLKVKLEKDTIWLTQAQVAKLFGTKRPAITKHLNNIFKSRELTRNSVCSILEHTAADGKKYQTKFYNLDMIISVGYRVNSKQATNFRIWATKTLKNHIVKGYTINSRRLTQQAHNLEKLQQTITFLNKKVKTKMLAGQGKELLNILGDYAKTFTLLEGYDHGKIKPTKGKRSSFVLEYDDCQDIIVSLKEQLKAKKEASNFFGSERNDQLESIIKNLYQTFGGKRLYQGVASQAAHLLYLIIKDHPFTDGNKRIASFLFIYFLDKNNYLYRSAGERKIDDNTLTTLALLVAESKPKEKDQLTALVTQLIK